MASDAVATEADVVQFAMRTPLTKEQDDDIWRAIHEWERIRRENGYDKQPTFIDVYKSCLLGRMLLEGKDPLPHPPPTMNSGPWYLLIEKGKAYLSAEFETPYFHEGSLLICGCSWRVVQMADTENDWIVEYPNYGRWRVRHLTAEEVGQKVKKGTTRRREDGTTGEEWLPWYYGEGDFVIERID